MENGLVSKYKSHQFHVQIEMLLSQCSFHDSYFHEMKISLRIYNYFPPTSAYHNPLMVSNPTSFNIDDDVSEKGRSVQWNFLLFSWPFDIKPSKVRRIFVYFYCIKKSINRLSTPRIRGNSVLINTIELFNWFY